MKAMAADDHIGLTPTISVPLQGSSIEVDTDSNDTDSSLTDSDLHSITTSISSSIVDYVYENGRRYHKFREGEYLFPNDETEQDRLDMVHHIFRMMLGGKLYQAPIPDSPKRILDIGTGTGIWVLDVADEVPGARILGIDLSPIQPQWVAPNCEFFVDDVETEWPYSQEKPFDYIHQRNMVGSISDWDRLFQQAYQHLQPGGYYEIQEFRAWFHSQDGPLPEDSSIALWQRLLTEGTARFGKPLNIVEKLPKKLASAGFSDVHEDILKIPIGAWPRDPKLKQIGQFMQIHAIDSVEPLTLALFTRVLGWSETECRILIAKVRQEFKDRKQLFVYAHFIHGRKAERGLCC
ncbi:class I SAM-dependent methyltransferase [Aspergillus clavatus NRRL 1]|uniref:S-adenosyl-L-methionine-dependent methyltransferase n=1 Tax=Aspergillus clavatus (strain ATCC 1007 / CBS 513.65 / DSM 816 / NCTC 3887 / NRRL 1 / QM 1276 / 107) TaxID=344612 RepID=A1CLJ3_ASPCL|nr:uncharacterized protein ACLA_042390 [Aspergillus clavatus NRRL 1]EAW10017.1 conserved hypothetical protein [Aspergillus clavatus NRRL 1]